jgi:hypothetical protein
VDPRNTANRYELEWSEEATADVAEIPVFNRRPVLAVIDHLRFQAEAVTRHRKPLREPIETLPSATWEVRVGEYRGLYWVEDGRIARILRVILKGTRTTRAAVTRSMKP